MLDKHGSVRLLARVFSELKADVIKSSKEYKRHPNIVTIKDRLCKAIVRMAMNPLVSAMGVSLKDVLMLANKDLADDIKITKADLLAREDILC